MGTDTPIAVLSERPRLLFDYFQQLFAQVTNPPLDAIREEVVTAVGVDRRPGGEPARSPAPTSCRQLALPFPIIDNDELAKIIHADDDGDRPRACRPSRRQGLYRVARRRRRRCGGRSTTICDEVVAGDRATAPGSSCCPTATPTRSRRRSRRCC